MGGHSLTGGHFGPMGDAGGKARGKTDDGTAFDVPWSTSPYAGSGPIGDVDYAASNKAAKIIIKSNKKNCKLPKRFQNEFCHYQCTQS